MNHDTRSTPTSAWYELGVKDTKTLVIKIHRKAMNALLKISWEKASAIKYFEEKTRVASFISPNQSPTSWGFGNVLLLEKEEADWLTYTCELPVVISKNQDEEKVSKTWSVRATLHILLTALWLFNEDTGCEHPQLIVIEYLNVSSELHGGALSATLTPAVVAWISQFQTDTRFDEIEDVMEAAHAHMWQNKRYSHLVHGQFRVHTRAPKKIFFNIPGDACDLSPECFVDQYHEGGYWLVPHNVDSSIQQLTFLMGLAKLHDLVRGIAKLRT